MARRARKRLVRTAKPAQALAATLTGVVTVGGTAPGGFNPVADDIFSESGVVPPVRIVEDGDLRLDLEEEYMRGSRMPELVAVDLRAQIAGCRVAVERVETLLERYVAPTLKGVMRKIQDDFWANRLGARVPTEPGARKDPTRP